MFPIVWLWGRERCYHRERQIVTECGAVTRSGPWTGCRPGPRPALAGHSHFSRVMGAVNDSAVERWWELDKGFFIDAISMNHPWFKVTCGQDQDRMTTEGKSVQLFSQNIQLARLTAVTETGKSCVSESLGLLLLYFIRAEQKWSSHLWPDKHLCQNIVVCYFEWLRWLGSEMRSYLRCLHQPGLISGPDIESPGVKMSRFIILGVTGSSKNIIFSLSDPLEISLNMAAFFGTESSRSELLVIAV